MKNWAEAECGAEVRAIAAITFTEKAAAELRDRIRQALERAAEQARQDGETTVAARCDAAMDQLDGAAIGTLHAFAQRILAENPIEVQLPPRVEILDEVTSDVQFEQRWSAHLDRLLDDPHLQRTLLLLFATGVKPTALRALALSSAGAATYVGASFAIDGAFTRRMIGMLARVARPSRG